MIMPNIARPNSLKRKIISRIIKSIANACPIWSAALSQKTTESNLCIAKEQLDCSMLLESYLTYVHTYT